MAVESKSSRNCNRSVMVEFSPGRRVAIAGSPARRRSDSVPGNEALLWRVQVHQVQEKVEVRQQLGQRGAVVHQVQDHDLSAEAGARNFERVSFSCPCTRPQRVWSNALIAVVRLSVCHVPYTKS